MCVLQYSSISECDGEEVDCLPAVEGPGGMPLKEGMSGAAAISMEIWYSRSADNTLAWIGIGRSS